MIYRNPYRHRFEVPESIDFGIQKGINFGSMFIKNTNVFDRFLYLNWVHFWVHFLGPLFSDWTISLLQTLPFGLSRTVFDAQQLIHFSTPRMVPKMVNFGVFSESIFGSIFWGHYFPTGQFLVFKHYHLV